MQIHLVPDTNVLLQCRQLRELPWMEEFPGTESLAIVLIAPVIRELDRQKGGQGRVAKRARQAASLIGELLDLDSVLLSRVGDVPVVRMMAKVGVQPDPELNAQLDYNIPDDVIVGTVAALVRAYPAENFELLSNDNGVLMNAKRLGLKFRRVPSGWLLPAESDEEQKRIKALEEEVKRFRKLEPDCRIDTGTEAWNFKVTSFEPLGRAEIRNLVADLRNLFPEATDFGPREMQVRRAPDALGICSIFEEEEFEPATEDEIRKYQEVSYPKWIRDCESFLRDLHRKLEDQAAQPRLVIKLSNVGSRPAEDVRVTFSVHGGGFLLRRPKQDEPIRFEVGRAQCESSPNELALAFPRPPVAPKGRWRRVRLALGQGISPLQAVGSALDLDRALPSRALLGLNKSFSREADSFYWVQGTGPEHPRPEAELTCEQWRHRFAPKEFQFELVWRDGMKPRNGVLHVELHAANLTNPVQANVSIGVQVEPGDTKAEARALIEALSLMGARRSL